MAIKAPNSGGIAEIKIKKEKVTALKLQLDFHKKVLEQKHADKTTKDRSGGS